MPKVSAVLFDYGLVLTGPPDASAWARMKDRLGMDENSFHAAYWAPRHDYDRGALDSAAYWIRVASRTLTASEHRQLVDDDTALWTQPNQPMIDWAATLQLASIKTGILSNLGDAMEAGIRARCRWLGGFAHHTFSHRLGIAKPDSAIYDHAAAGLQTDPQSILFVDDREDNIAGAKAAGMLAIQYVDHAAFVQSMHDDGFGYLMNPIIGSAV